MKIVIKIFGEPVELDVNEAKKLYAELGELFGKEQPNYNPVPVFPWQQPTPPTPSWPSPNWPPNTTPVTPWKQPDVVWCSSVSVDDNAADGETMFFIEDNLWPSKFW